jgi:tetratricopeptide (TPR) repeat protein
LQIRDSIDINTGEHAMQVFTSGWFYMLSKKYTESINMYLSVLKYYYKLSRSVNGNNLNSIDFDDMRMTYINLGHSYLLSGNYEKAKEYYTDKILDKDFSETYEYMTKTDILKIDWNDFISNGLITKSQIDEFNKKYKIVDQL